MIGRRRLEDAISGVAVLAFIGAIGFLLAHCTACKPASSPRAQARAVVLSVAEGVKVADLACAEAARAKLDASLARGCAVAYDDARAALLAAESAVDATDATEAGKLPCALAHAVTALRTAVGLVETHGGKVPAAAEDALMLASAIGGCNG